MGYVVGALIVSLCLYLVVQPFLSGQKQWRTDEVKDDLDELTLEQIYATINELEMEFNMGKLLETDYQTLKNQYERMAAKRMKEDAYQDEAEGKSADSSVNVRAETDPSIEAEIEQELEELRKLRKGE